jgi:Beta xylosidase C-terminal Concanavalin A-like domain
VQESASFSITCAFLGNLLMNRSRAVNSSILGFSLVVTLAAGAGSLGSGPGAPLASSFPGPLWDVVAPAGGTASVTNAHLILNVPGGSNHDVLRPSNQAVRVVQPIANSNFDVSIRIDSPIVPTAVGTSQGLMALADDQNFITFGMTTDGTNVSLNAQTVTGGAAKVAFNQTSFNEYHGPICLRLNRQGNTYTAYYSVDGEVWTQAASFVYAQAPTLVGPFASNYNQTPVRAVPVVMAVNWFHVL